MTAKLKAVAEAGEQIYRERYKADFEMSHPGMYVAIDVSGGQPFIADSPERALRAALNAIPGGKFHLIQVGAQAVFRVGYSRCGTISGGRTLDRAGRDHRDPPIRVS